MYPWAVNPLPVPFFQTMPPGGAAIVSPPPPRRRRYLLPALPLSPPVSHETGRWQACARGLSQRARTSAVQPHRSRPQVRVEHRGSSAAVLDGVLHGVGGGSRHGAGVRVCVWVPWCVRGV